LGPKTNVLLDTVYNDERIRIGMGGTSGSKFVFSRCSKEEEEEATAFRALLQQPPVSKPKALTLLGGVVALGFYGAFVSSRRLVFRLLDGVIAGLASLLAMLVAFSSGGIERDDTSAQQVVAAQ